MSIRIHFDVTSSSPGLTWSDLGVPALTRSRKGNGKNPLSQTENRKAAARKCHLMLTTNQDCAHARTHARALWQERICRLDSPPTSDIISYIYTPYYACACTLCVQCKTDAPDHTRALCDALCDPLYATVVDTLLHCAVHCAMAPHNTHELCLALYRG